MMSIGNAWSEGCCNRLYCKFLRFCDSLSALTPIGSQTELDAELPQLAPCGWSCLGIGRPEAELQNATTKILWRFNWNNYFLTPLTAAFSVASALNGPSMDCDNFPSHIMTDSYVWLVQKYGRQKFGYFDNLTPCQSSRHPPLACNRRAHRRMVGWLRAVTAQSIHSGSTGQRASDPIHEAMARWLPWFGLR